MKEILIKIPIIAATLWFLYELSEIVIDNLIDMNIRGIRLIVIKILGVMFITGFIMYLFDL